MITPDDNKPTDETPIPVTPTEDGFPVTGDNGETPTAAPEGIVETVAWGDVAAFDEEDDEDDDGTLSFPVPSSEAVRRFTHEPLILEFNDIVPWSDNPEIKIRRNYISVINRMDSSDLNTVIRAAKMFIKKWIFPTSPQKQRSYDLDVSELWKLNLELIQHFADVYPDNPVKPVELTFGDSFPGNKHPTLVGDVGRMNSEDVATLMPVISQSLVAWEFDGDWRDAKYVLALPAPILKDVYQQVNAFWYERLFKNPKSGRTGSSSA